MSACVMKVQATGVYTNAEGLCTRKF